MIKLITIKRIARLKHATLGVIFDESDPFAVTLELPWKANQRDISCIPPTPQADPILYLCRRMQSPRHGDTFEVLDVPNRSEILCTHVGNQDEDTLGCILVAEEFGVLNGEVAILRSRQGVDEFHQRLRYVQEFALRIQWCL